MFPIHFPTYIYFIFLFLKLSVMKESNYLGKAIFKQFLKDKKDLTEIRK